MEREIRMTTAADAWQALADWQPQKLTDLVAADPEARLQALVRRVADIRFDFAKTHLDERAVAILSDLAVAQGFAARRDRKSVVEGKSVSVRVDLGGRRIIKTRSRRISRQ